MAENTSGVAVIKVIGVGGGGGNAINNMVKGQLQGVDFIAANTDSQDLARSKADILLQIGPTITKGGGAGMVPEVGAQAAHESIEDIKNALKGSDMVFVAAGLGGGTGTGAAPVVAKVSKELGALTIAVVTKPFSFEGKARMRNAEAGWEELRKNVDTIITVPNDRLLSLMQKTSKFADMCALADNVLMQAVKGITDLINGHGVINADFADLRTVMRETGPAIMGTGVASGENRALEAAKRAIDNRLLEDTGIEGARGLIINVSATYESLTLSEYTEVSALIQSKVDDEANVVLGVLHDETLGDELRVTVIATGLGNVVSKNKPLGLGEEARSPLKIATTTQEVPATAVAPAPANPRPFFGQPVSSGASGFDTNVAPPLRWKDAPRNAKEAKSWNDDYLETPTYLRKKAN
jgi:cell division protein FtsZ